MDASNTQLLPSYPYGNSEYRQPDQHISFAQVDLSPTQYGSYGYTRDYDMGEYDQTYSLPTPFPSPPLPSPVGRWLSSPRALQTSHARSGLPADASALGIMPNRPRQRDRESLERANESSLDHYGDLYPAAYPPRLSVYRQHVLPMADSYPANQPATIEHTDSSQGLPTRRIISTAAVLRAAERRRFNPHKFFCQYCSRGFTAKHNYDRHISAHNDDRPHLCGCGSTFTTKSDLKRHQARSKKHPPVYAPPNTSCNVDPSYSAVQSSP